MIDFGREVCGRAGIATSREWLVTNGIGGYAAGTVAGILTRRYHGLLVAALKPPLGRTLTLAKLDESATYDGYTYALYANQWADGTTQPEGFRFLDRFHLDGTTPTWTFAFGDALLLKRVWMQPGANTTYVDYEVVRGSGPVSLGLDALVTYRDHHHNTDADQTVLSTVSVNQGLHVKADNDRGFYLLSYQALSYVREEWRKGFELGVERFRGLPSSEDLLQVGTFRATLFPGQSITVVASTEPGPNLDGQTALLERKTQEQELLTLARQTEGPRWVQQLVLAADQFIVRRSFPDQTDGRTVIAGYPWFGDWGRDTMISLPGLTLSTGRPDVAARVLRTFARYVDQGMVPNHFPEVAEKPEYNTADASLWYVDAVRAYYAATGDRTLVRDLLPTLQDIIVWHLCGTRHQIRVDPVDGLLRAGEPGVQLTWMDAKVGDWVVTPRIGKPVEVNALWYSALRSMANLASVADQSGRTYAAAADRVQAGFARFWHASADYCYDVLDGPDGNDDSLRPNQILAVSLPFSPLSPSQQKAVVDVCARRLLTSLGLRTLCSSDHRYKGTYGGDQRHRDAAYHQGTVWAWLIGPFVRAHLRVYRNPAMAQSFLEPFARHLSDHGLGSISEIFEGDAPFMPRGCFAQAWSVAEVIRAWDATVRASSDPTCIESLL